MARIISVILVSILTVFWIGIVTTSAHETPKRSSETAAEIERHKQLDFGFRGFAKLNSRLTRDFLSFDNSRNLALAAAFARSPGLPNSNVVGAWSPVFSLPLVPIQVVLLTNGKLLMWDSVGDDPTETYPVQTSTRAAIWDPLTNDVARVDNAVGTGTGYNIFCSGFAHLPDGTPFIAGGNRNEYLDGIDTTHLFDQVNNAWVLGPTMAEGNRWYPSVTPLASGELLITSGGPPIAEVYSAAGTLRSLTNAAWYMELYPWLQAAPNGNVLYFGPSNEIRYIGTAGTGELSDVQYRDSLVRSYGSYAMYDIGKIVASGGGLSSSKTVVIDVKDPNVDPVVEQPADMAFGRRQHSLTVLPDGTVLATGGNETGAALIDMDGNVFEAELWNPVTKTWTTLSGASEVRQYHSTAILLPDGRVFTGGGGICRTCADVGYLQKNMEIFTPPYLYNKDGSGTLAARPTINTAPAMVTYNDSFAVETPDAANITSVVMMRISSDTHSVNFEQRRVPLAFSNIGNGLSVIAPPNGNIAPPGMYMLFLIDSSGVPSVAKMVSVQHGAGLGAPMIVATEGGNSKAKLDWIPVPGAINYTIRYGTVSGSYTNSVQVGDVTTVSLTGLTREKYYFAVSAENGTASGGNSAEVAIETNLAPTETDVIVAGRVTSSNGTGLAQVRVAIAGGGLAEPRIVTTNPFGYYRFNDVAAGQTYVLTVSAKRYSFVQSPRLLSVFDDMYNVDFTTESLSILSPAPIERPQPDFISP